MTDSFSKVQIQVKIYDHLMLFKSLVALIAFS